MDELKITPIRAAKILGPALIGFFLMPSVCIKYFERFAKGLYADNSALRKKKSTSKNIIGIIFCVNKNTASNTTVRPPLKRATFSSIFLLEIGHIAFEFISLCFKFVTDAKLPQLCTNYNTIRAVFNIP